MSSFRQISVSELDNNFFTAFSDDWTLITAKKPGGEVNTMTASWGGVGFMWNRPVFMCVIRPQRYTYEFTESTDTITLSFFGGAHREALNLCGSKSGRDIDKIAASGLTPVKDGGAVYFKEATLVLTGRKLYADRFKKECFTDKSMPPQWYASDDFHRVYICEITGVLVKE